MDMKQEKKGDKLKITVGAHYKLVLNEHQPEPMEITEVTNKLTGVVEKIISINPNLVSNFKGD